MEIPTTQWLSSVEFGPKLKPLVSATISCCALICASNSAVANSDRELLWGDTHLHSSYSFDAYLNQNKSADPDTAYRWAKGQWVMHPYTKARIRINTPLDFLVVSDHAELMGVLKYINENDGGFEDIGLWGNFKRWLSVEVIRSAIADGTGVELFLDVLPKKLHQPGTDPVKDPGNPPPNDTLSGTKSIEQQTWHDIIDTAEKHNEPGSFTTFMGWEWSSIPAGANLHRIVISPNGAEKAKQYKPFSFLDSPYPEDLWAWLDKTQKETGSEFIAIPHNSNISKGYMFDEKTLHQKEITKEYARTRMHWEPIVEVTQIKGDSEAHPSLSPNDQFAGFEPFNHYLQTEEEEYKARPGDYARTALGRGLKLEEKTGVNPYKFGMIGSTDAHTGLSSAEEENFWGKMAYDSIPENKAGGTFSDEDSGPKGWDMAAQGLAAVWADNNDRQSIFQAMRRKEVYASTGPRMSLRFFAGWTFSQDDVNAEDFAERGYRQGVPMGGDLYPNNENQAPRFIIQATMDPKSSPLERVEIIKGWLDADGKNHEQIYTVAASDQRELPIRGQLDKAPAEVRNNQVTSTLKGSKELLSYWQDPDFKPEQKAFYYVRVLQMPSLRHSTMDAQALQQSASGYPSLIQERAYSSPVWYNP